MLLGTWSVNLTRAAEEPKGESKTAEHKGGSEEVNIFAPALGLGFWSVVVFVVLLLTLRKYAWNPMLEGLQKREQTIHGALEEARLAQEQAQRTRDQFQKQMDNAQEKVRDLLDAARRDAQRATDEMIAKARSEMQVERERLHREIDQARDQALEKLWSQAAKLATLVSAKAIRRHLNVDDHRQLVDEAIADLRRAGSERRRQSASV
jgi:F-type H+-transporting ATPase subunit b